MASLDQLLIAGATDAVRIQERMNEAADVEAALYRQIAARWPADLLPVISPLAPRHRIVDTHEFECAFAVGRERATAFNVRLLNTSVSLLHRQRVERQSRIRLTVVQTPYSRLESIDGSQHSD